MLGHALAFDLTFVFKTKWKRSSPYSPIAGPRIPYQVRERAALPVSQDLAIMAGEGL
jgi:hypothetical protein